MMWIMLISLPGKKVFPDLVDISGSHGYQQIIISAICQKIIFDFLESREVEAIASELEDLLLQSLRTDAQSVCLAGGVDVREDHKIGVRQRLCKALEE